MPRWIAILLLVFSPQVFATPTINDFAYRADLTTASERLQRVELPIDVLLDLTNSNLADIAVFDANGKPLPHSVQKVLRQKFNQQIDLKFHVFDSFKKQNSKVVTTREQNQQDGQLSEIQTTESIQMQQIRQDYLIELPDNPGVTDLELEWQHEPKNQVLQVKIEVGTNLDNLRSIDNHKVLSNVNVNAPEWRFIRKIPTGQKYLRITAADNINSFELQQVTGHYQEREPEHKIWHTVEVSTVNIDDKKYQSFESPSSVIANAIRITPGEPHSSLEGRLYASNTEFKQKQRINPGFRQHNITGDEVKPSRAIPLPNRSYQHWRIALDHQPDVLPLIKIAYPVYEIIFLANESAPFTLAWGNYNIKGQTGKLAELMNDDFNQPDKRGSLVDLKSIQLAGGVSRLAPEVEFAWKKWLLWALLIIAVLVTGRMAFGLYRDMNR